MVTHFDPNKKNCIACKPCNINIWRDRINKTQTLFKTLDM